MTKTELCNQALGFVKSKFITDFDGDTTTPAQLCRLYFASALQECLEDMGWSFAARRATLSAPLQDAPLSGYKYAFQLPADCLMVESTEPTDVSWKVEGKTLITDEPSIGIVYTYDVLDTMAPSAKFLFSLVLNIAWKLAMPITGDRSLTNDLSNQYREAIAMARSRDSQIGSREVDALDLLINVRR